MLEPIPRQPAAGTSAAADAADADTADSDDGDGVQPSAGAAAGQAGSDNLRSTELAEAPNMQRLFWKVRVGLAQGALCVLTPQLVECLKRLQQLTLTVVCSSNCTQLRSVGQLSAWQYMLCKHCWVRDAPL